MIDLPISILVAEDDPDDRLLLAQAFNAVASKADIKFVENGLELLEALRRNASPDLVILDLNMPLLDGRQALQQIRNDPLLREQKIIVLTTSFAPEEEESCRAQGVVDYLRKPSRFSELVDIVSVVMRMMLKQESRF